MRSMLLSAVVGMSALSLPLAGPSAAHADEKPATIRVTLPADATLTFDGQPTQSTSGDRLFQTPALETGKVFHYTLRATHPVVRGEDTVTVERQVAAFARVQENGRDAARRGRREPRALLLQPCGAGVLLQPIPPLPFYIAPDLDTPRGGVAPARDNWKPDFSDPFIR